MATDKGHLSGVNKSESGTGTPATISSEKMKDDQQLTEKHTDDDNEIGEGIRQMHPNRNEDKDSATNIGGYRS